MDIKRILVPCDLDDASSAAIHYARMFAQRFAARVTVMYADPVLFPMEIGEAIVADRLNEEAEARLSDKLRKFVNDEAGPGFVFDTKIVPGSVVPTISITADKLNADLIVIGTHGDRGWGAAILGSVTDGVIHASDHPVLAVQAHRRRLPRIARILCPVNMTEIARRALHAASDLATRFAAELIVVHVAGSGDEHQQSSDLRRWLAGSAPFITAWRELIVRGGGATERVLDCAEDIDADLLVIGAQHKFIGDATVIGSTSERLIRFSPIPVMTIIGAAKEKQREIELAECVAS